MLTKYLSVAALLGVSLSFPFQVVRVYDRSMLPALEDGEYLLVQRMYRPSIDVDDRGKIVVAKNGSAWVIKRLFAIGGDRVIIDTEGNVYLDSDGSSPPLVKGNGEIASVINVPKGHVYLVGDNRHESVDSRKFGAVSQGSVKGIAVFP